MRTAVVLRVGVRRGGRDARFVAVVLPMQQTADQEDQQQQRDESTRVVCVSVVLVFERIYRESLHSTKILDHYAATPMPINAPNDKPIGNRSCC